MATDFVSSSHLCQSHSSAAFRDATWNLEKYTEGSFDKAGEEAEISLDECSKYFAEILFYMWIIPN